MKEIDFGDILPYSNFCVLVPTVTASLLFLTVVTFLQSWLSRAIISVVTSFSLPQIRLFYGRHFENAKERMQLYK